MSTERATTLTKLFINAVETNFDNPSEDLTITAHVADINNKPIACLTLEFKTEIAFATQLEILAPFDDAIRMSPIVNYAHLQLCIMNALHRASNHETEIPYAPDISEPVPVIID